MKVLFVASECTPLAKVGGLGDVIGALPKALINLGCDVRIAIPKYRIINEKKYPSKLIASNVPVKKEFINIYQSFLPESKVPIYLLENEEFFGENDIYFEKTAFVGNFSEIKRFLFLSEAVLEIFPVINWFPEVIHCHDWHTAIITMLLKLKTSAFTKITSFTELAPDTKSKSTDKQNSKLKNIKTLLTVHNLANQGKWKAEEIFSFLGLKEDEDENLKTRDKEGNFNILQQGIICANFVNTVSKGYAKEILTSEYGSSLENWLVKRKKDLSGILNGIDNVFFNPEIDPNIKTNYSFETFSKKIENKIELQKILKFEENAEIPLFGIINRLTDQKGVDLIIDIIPEIVKFNYQLIILGVGKKEYEKKLLELSIKYPKNVSAQIKFDVVLAQKIYAGCDIFLIPSRFEPCGLGQMIAMRYGTIPIARKTGGLAETIKDKKTGFLFKKYKSSVFLKSIKEALRFYRRKEKWQNLVKLAMEKNFSWEVSAKRYLKLYKKLLNV